MFHFYASWKRQKTFSGGVEMEQMLKMGYIIQRVNTYIAVYFVHKELI